MPTAPDVIAGVTQDELDAAVEELNEQVEQQQALGYEQTDSSVVCPSCGDTAQFVSNRSIPLTGPLHRLTPHSCRTDAGVYYHWETAD